MDMELIQRPFGIYEKAIKPQEWEKMFADASSAGYRNYEISLDESDARLARLHWDDKQYDEAGCTEPEHKDFVSVFQRAPQISAGKQFQGPGGAGNPDDERGNRLLSESGGPYAAGCGV